MRLAVALATLPASPRAQAAPPVSEAESVVVTAPLCKADAFPLASFLDSLQVELAGRGLRCCTLADPGEQTVTPASVRVKLELVPCAADADRVEVTVEEPGDSRVIEREISLADVAPSARARALALAVAELIRSLGAAAPGETRLATPVSPERSLPRPISPKPSRSKAARPLVLSLRLEGEVRGLPLRRTILWGGRLRLTTAWRVFHADLDFGANYGRARVELGDVLVRSASAGVGFGPRVATRAAVIDLGLHAELGWAWIRGETAWSDVRTRAGSDLISTLGFRASLELPAELKVRPCLTVESGGVLRGVNGDMNGHPVAGIAGYYVLAALGVVVSP